MKKRDLILIISIVVLACFMWWIPSVLPQDTDGKLLITVDNQQFGIYDLTEDRTITIEETNICKVENREVSMIYGECPDQVCVHSVPISKTGQTIICMPNKVVLEIVKGDIGEIDTVAE